MPTISIIIPTFARGDSVINTINSILKNPYKNIEIIVIEQGKYNAFKNHKYLLKDKHIRYFKLKNPNASRAKNLGIQKSKGKFLAFTDDDCIVTKNWLNNILLAFNKNSGINAVFGSVYEYKPHLHKNQVCPSVFKQKHDKVITEPEYHKDLIGFGNNFIVKKETLIKLGFFKEWLGPGSIGCAAEDAELAIRILLNRGRIMYSHKVKIMHNNWLNPSEMSRLMLLYNCGEIACYGYLYLKGNNFAKKVVCNNFKAQLKLIKANLIKYKKFGINKSILTKTSYLFTNLGYEIKGVGIAIFYSIFQRVFIENLISERHRW